MSVLVEIRDDVLEAISGGGPDGGAPMQTQTTTTTTTSISASGTVSGGYKKIAGASVSGSVSEKTETTIETLQPCPAPTEQWKGVPYR